MIARLLISPDITKIKKAVAETLALPLTRGLIAQEGIKLNHPDVLHFRVGEKLGITEARRIKAHFSLKPYSAKGRVVVVEDAGVLTVEAQNALLKTLEELPQEAILILGASTDSNFLPTILSRCQITRLDVSSPDSISTRALEKNLENLFNSTIQERFEYVEKLKDKEEFLHAIIQFFRQKLFEPVAHEKPGLAKLEKNDFLKELLQAEEWVKQNVNIRAILEYLMLVMPSEM